MADDQLPALVRALKSTSEKIRALATSGYSRVEIARLLKIRYQHVRKVLLDAGITDGMVRDAKVPQPPIPVVATPGPQVSPAILLEAGFRQIGRWMIGPNANIGLEGRAPNEPGVYAFTLDDVIVYVGVTLRSLQGRMRQYRRGDPRQRTSARIHGRIQTALSAGHSLEVLIATPEMSKWNGLPVNVSAGLEVALIQTVRPEWNIQIGTKPST